MSKKSNIARIRSLARKYGVQTSYDDVAGVRQNANPESLLHVLKVLGAPLESLADAPAALEHWEAEHANRLVEPVSVVWDGRRGQVVVQASASILATPIDVQLSLENGEVKHWRCHWNDLKPALPTKGDWTPKGSSIGFLNTLSEGSSPLFCAPDDNADAATRQFSLPLPVSLPLGYHRLKLDCGGRAGEVLIIAAPRRSKHSVETFEHQWGIFAPMHAVHGSRGWGAGGVREFEQLTRWVAQLGGRLVAALPLLASFYDYPEDISPYSPASRLFWNEFFIDVERIPEFTGSTEAKRLCESPEFQRVLGSLQAATIVNATHVMEVKRGVLEILVARFFAESSIRREEFERYRAANPELDVYARFRSACERRGRPFINWPEPMRSGELESELDESRYRYHLFAQWVIHDQLDELSRSARAAGMTWYLDLPLGTHPDGFDVWRYPDVFATGAAGGAPPDSFFTQGQNWGFPPLHPERQREQHYEYFIRVVRHHLQQARLLRLDHVMGLHRFYWVPHGLPASQGVYVRYPAEELYAILMLEAHRLDATIIGENLGTVPSYLNRAMRQHGFGRLYVLQYEANAATRDSSIRQPDPDEVASMNTHDMPTFASWWRGDDINDRIDLGLMTTEEADVERSARAERRRAIIQRLYSQKLVGSEEPELKEVMGAALRSLASSEARVLLINLEDLWLETQSQNTPGTVTERVNWRRKTKLSLEQIEQDHEMANLLRQLRTKSP